MKTKADKMEGPRGRRGNGRFAASQAKTQRFSGGVPETAIGNAAPSRVAQAKLQDSIDGSPRQLAQAERLSVLFGPPVQREEGVEPLQEGGEVAQCQGLEDEEDLLQGRFESVQRQGLEDEELMQGKFEPVQRQPEEEEELMQGRFGASASAQLEAEAAGSGNSTGMPDQLKAGLERLSGMDLSDVQVHRGSSKPARVNALAYAQGGDIHLGSGQEKHLPHEAWHVVQQRQGRVRPTMQVSGVQVNDDPGLEQEADVMGEKAITRGREEEK